MLNPILYTEKIVSDFLKYQLTAYPFADSHLYEQMRGLLNLEKTRHTPLFKGPYISLSRSFREGAKISTLVKEGLLHPHLTQIAAYPTLYGHQETAIRAILNSNPTLVSTGTGSGKTECFLYPIISHCLDLRDENAPPGIVAVIVYPMNALAEDQLGRLRELLCGSGISFGMYVGKTPEKTAAATGQRLKPGASRLDYQKALKKSQQEKQSYAIYPPEERVSREEMRKNPPRILLTNVNQLELLLTRGRDVELFDRARLDYLVFDEAHTFSGAAGAETACLIRRLRSFCGKSAGETTCIATSATIADPEQGLNAGKDFAVRFFGIDADRAILVREEYQQDDWQPHRQLPPPLSGNPAVQLRNVLDALDNYSNSEQDARTPPGVGASRSQSFDSSEQDARTPPEVGASRSQSFDSSEQDARTPPGVGASRSLENQSRSLENQSRSQSFDSSEQDARTPPEVGASRSLENQSRSLENQSRSQSFDSSEQDARTPPEVGASRSLENQSRSQSFDSSEQDARTPPEVGASRSQSFDSSEQDARTPPEVGASRSLENQSRSLENQSRSLENQLLVAVFQGMTGEALDVKNWQESLYNCLAANELVYQIADALKKPRLLPELVGDLQRRSDRPISEEEILAWLALGASSRKDNRPLLRPVIHGFIRGVGGAVVTFPSGQTRPQLWLSAEDAVGESGGDGLFRLPVTTCTTCGQHYFSHHVGDFKFFDKQPEGGQLTEHRVIWKPLSSERGGDRVILLDKLVTDDENIEDYTDDFLSSHSSEQDARTTGVGASRSLSSHSRERQYPNSTVPLYFCRHCGTLHDLFCDRCRGCGHPGGLIELLAVRQKSKYPGKLSSCVTCQALGRHGVGGYREPTRPVRAVTVSDVHVLAQNAIHYAERRRLLIFADNRQDAAFQSGWMRDRARRYRLRSLMYDRIQQSEVSIGDLTAYLDDLLDDDDELSRTLIPEVWDVERKEAAGQKHRQERKYFLRIAVLREIATGVKQRIGLEPWGRMKIHYLGLTPDLEFIQKWATFLRVSPEELIEGIASLLDVSRRGNILFDPEGRIFSRFWKEGDREIQRGYLPLLQGVPKGLKLQRDPADNANRVQQWLSAKGDTLARQAARNWGIHKDSIAEFYEELWELLTEQLKILVQVPLLSSRNQPLRGCNGVYQIDADKIRLTSHQGIYRCQICRRSHIRPTPKLTCMAWRCSGTLEYEEENADNYDLMVLDQQFTTLRAREHSAQVPAKEREILERLFKGDGEYVNTLVCTPTLEMGVDIGGLDAVLMRNVPPLPANYWQRAGRAGRRHRMAVNLTYARQASHDRAYFNDPMKLLNGAIAPPRFNLRNPLMVEKHVHATVLTVLHQLRRGEGNLTKGDREEIADILKTCFPTQVKPYLFDENGNVRQVPLSVDRLSHLIAKTEPILSEKVAQVFAQQWPTESVGVVTPAKLRDYILNTGDRLAEVIDRLWKRLQWSLNQMARLDAVRQRKGTLDPDEEALRQRCDRLVKKLKGIQSRRKRESEGYDDINTYSVLAAEGFLPGYGLEVGSVLGVAQVPRHLMGISDFELPRPSATALREYVPGNLIYANGHRFVPRFYHLEPQQQLTLFQVDVTNEAIAEVGVSRATPSSLSIASLRAVPICDVDLPHQSHISDEEDYRFQMAVSIVGSEQNRHSGGKAYQWGQKTALLRQGVHLRLVNVGAANWSGSVSLPYNNLGYPVCTVCGQTRSPLSSDGDRAKFAEDHAERCGQPVEPTGFFADIVVDVLTIQDCANRQEAYSIAEALRFGAANILEMELDDLQVLAIAYPGQEKVDAMLYDPMPGGSGLLDRICDRWIDVTSAALEVTVRCPAVCDTACIDCLFTYRNSYYHRHLNRHLATEKINEWGHELQFGHDIPPKLPNVEETSGEKPVNNPETILRDMLQRASFPTPAAQYAIDLGRPLGTTTPDFFYEDPTERFEGICIYLDGMSRHLHGDPDRQKRDRDIREQLRYEGYEVIEIPVGNLSDRGAMAKVFFRLGQILLGKAQAKTLRDNPESWFEVASSEASAAVNPG
ncbi:DEAD/DEAH box helicase [Oxynema aestuarii]|nr:DEAD/DEAH box helicase [Oxynema aestuarii]